jgi:hypothetical protein
MSITTSITHDHHCHHHHGNNTIITHAGRMTVTLAAGAAAPLLARTTVTVDRALASGTAGMECSAALPQTEQTRTLVLLAVVVGEGHAPHRVRLPRPRLSVRENGDVVALEARSDERQHRVGVHVVLRRVGAKHIVEGEHAVLST